MERQTKTLLIVSVDRKVNNFLRTIIHNIIGGKVKVQNRTSDEIRYKPVQADVVMTSGAFLVPRVRAVYPGTTIIAPKRLITGYNLEKVLMLPRSTRVLVVNHPRSASEETIESLKNLGITHLEYTSYRKGAKSEPERFGAAISPGMSHLCPKGVKPIIDIGPRIISVYSFLELLIALDLDLSYLENFATYYHNFLMESSRKLAAVLEQSELLRKVGEIILNQFEDGVLSVTESGEIDTANRSAARLFKMEVDAVLKTNVSDLLARFKHRTHFTDQSQSVSRASSICNYDGKQILIQKIPVIGENLVRQVYTFREIAKIQRLEKNVRVHLARKGHVTKYGFDDIWTAGKVVTDLKERALNFAATEKNILITGESGTGKELFAHAIHGSSSRRDGPFVAVNFAGIPESLIESELFGYEPGAFTGAVKGGKTGLFEQAHGGTIFLDEIGDAPLNVQSRLLRVLQEKEIMKVGGSRITPVDARIIAGTNRDLIAAMRERKFRSDLYYRLNTLPLEIPPLREHKEDIPYILGRHLGERCGVRKRFPASTARRLEEYEWPGNTRELINIAEYIRISSRDSDTVEPEHLPRSFSDFISMNREEAPHASGESRRALMERLRGSSVPFESLCDLLRILKERKRLVSGRRSLAQELAQRNHHVTEGRMKTCLRILRSAGLVHIGATKQGTVLTPKGEDFLENLR